MKTKLDYTSGATILPQDATGISPSQLYKFFDKPHEWYREQVLGESGFEGSTASYLGTVVHFVAEDYAKRGEVDKSEIYKYLSKELSADHKDDLDWDDHEAMELYLCSCNSKRSDIDIAEIITQYKIMGNALIQHLVENQPSRTEEVVSAEVMPGYHASGSCDAVLHDRKIVDYKTTSDLNPKTYIPYNYKLQLLTYAWIYKQQGVPIDTISITWITRNQTGRVSEKTGKAMKDYPTQVINVPQKITDEDWDFIESLLKLVSESLEFIKEDPTKAYLVFKDYRLKNSEKRKLDGLFD